MAKRVKLLAWLSAAVLALALVATAILTMAGPRSFLARSLLSLALWQRGYHLAGGRIVAGRDTVTAFDLKVTDRDGIPVATARKLAVAYEAAGLYGGGDRRLGIRSIVADHPMLHVVRLEGGGYNVSQLFAREAAVGVGPAAPWRLSVVVTDGSIVVDSPTAAKIGRHFSIDDIALSGRIDQGGLSTARLTGILLAAQRRTPLNAELFENDQNQFAQAALRADGAPIAPVFDALVPTHAFSIEEGTADVRLRAYAISYDSLTGPQWELSGDAQIYDGRFRVVPLVVPVQHVSGTIRLSAGQLASSSLSGSAAVVPVNVVGALRVFGGVRFALGVRGFGDLHDLRKLFAFSRNLPVQGPVQVGLRIDGPTDNLDVSGFFSDPLASYAGVPVSALSGSFFYNEGHLSIVRIAAGYDSGLISGDGDIDFNEAVYTGKFVATAAMPASRVPIMANISPDGRSESLLTIAGPLSSLSGWAYARLYGGSGPAVDASFAAGPDRFIAGPMRVRSSEGEMLLAALVDRRAPGGPTIDADIVATNAPLTLESRAVSLPGINDTAPIALPAMNGIANGALAVRGPLAAPRLALDADASGLAVAGVRLGDLSIDAQGAGGDVRIERVSLLGSDVRVNAAGFASLAPQAGAYAAVLQGTGDAELSALHRLAPSPAMQGRTRGEFQAALARGRWLVSAHAISANAVVAGVSVLGFDATIGGGDAEPASVYAGDVVVGDGRIAALGTVPAGAASSGALQVWADRFDLRALQPLGVPLSAGTAVAIARLRGTLRNPTVDGATVVTGASYRGVPLAGDVDFHYSQGKLVADSGRVDIDGQRANIGGVISEAPSAGSLDRAALSVGARLRDGDLGKLFDRYLPASVPLRGAVQADLRIAGTVGSPQLDGIISSQTGTLRGVAFDDLRGLVHAKAGRLRVESASIRVGSSQFDFGGSLSASDVSLRTSSSNVDLSDFNDFFNGYDVLEGRGSASVALASSPGRLRAAGRVDLADAALGGVPIGAIHAEFTGAQNSLLARLHSEGAAGTSSLSGSILFPTREDTLLPDFARARYDVSGKIEGIDVGVLAPLVHQSDLGLTGKLDVSGFARGELARPTAHASFTLRDGHLRKLPITALSGVVDSNGKITTLTHASATLPFARTTGQAQFGPGDRLSASARIDAEDLGKVSALVGIPGALQGKASADLNVSGTRAKPLVATTVESERGQAYGISYDRFSARGSYTPGELEIGDSHVDLAGKRGTLTLAGALPLRLSPFGLGPKNKALNLSVDAKGVELAALDPLIERFAQISGTLDAKIVASGQAGNPVLAGTAHLRDGSVRSPWERVPLSAIEADVTLAQDTVTLNRLHGSLGRGSLDARGAAHVIPAVGLLQNSGLQYASHVDVRNAQLDVPNWISGTFDGSFSLTKSGATPYLAGTVTMSDGAVPFSAIYALATDLGQAGAPPATGRIPGVPAAAPGHIVVYGGEIYGEGIHVLSAQPAPRASASSGFVLPSVDLNVTAGAGRNVRVKGGAINLTASGSVSIADNLRSPTVDGVFTSSRGQVTYFDTVFRLQRASVTFAKSEGLLPTLDVRASTNTSGEDIDLAISGRIDNLTTSLSSNPPLSRDQIVATLLREPLVASAVSATPDQAQAILAGEAQTYFNAQLTRSLLFPFESALAESLNIEEIAFIFDQQGNVNVEVRKRVTPTVNAIYRSTLAVPVAQTFGAAYALRDYASIDFLQTQTMTGKQSFTAAIRFTFK